MGQQPPLIVLAWQPQSGVATLDGSQCVTAAANDLRMCLLDEAMEFNAVATQADLEAVNETLTRFSQYVDRVTEEHKAQKAPFLIAGRALDEAKNKALEQIEPERVRLKGLAKSFLEKERLRQVEEERKRQAEVLRIQREKAEAEARAAREKAAAEEAERRRVAEEARIAEEQRAARATAEAARLAAEKAAHEAELKAAWDNSVEGKAEAQRLRDEAEARRVEAEAAAKAEQERLAAEQNRLAAERARAVAAEKLRQEEAALQAAVHQQQVESVTAAAPVEKIPTRWSWRIKGRSEIERKANMIWLASKRPHLFEITPVKSELNALAKEIKAGEHDLVVVEFFEEVTQRTSK